MSIIKTHLAKIEEEIQQIAKDGHLTKDVVMARFVNAIEYELHEARREVEDARLHDRDGDSISPGG